MAKTRQAKEELKQNLTDKFHRMKLAILIQYQGLKVKESEELRRNLREAGIEMVVPKNTIAKMVLKEEGIEVSSEVFDRPLALVFAYDDEVKPAKEITLFAKTHEMVEILGGLMDRRMVDAALIKTLASLPSREELLAKMAGSIKSPLFGLVNVLSGVPRGLITALHQIESKKS